MGLVFYLAIKNVKSYFSLKNLAIITQLVRVLGCDSKSRGFKSRCSPFILSCIKSNALNGCLNIKKYFGRLKRNFITSF